MGDIDDFERSTQRARQIRMVVMSLVLAAPFLWLGWRCHKEHAKRDAWIEEAKERNRLSAAEKAELDKLMTELHATVRNASKAFAEDVTPEKLEVLVPGDAPCPISRRSKADDLDAKLGTHYAMLEMYELKLTKPGDQPKPDAIVTAAKSLADLEERVKRQDGGEATKYDLESARSMAGELSDVMFVVGERHEPAVMSDSYIPGTVRGTAYLYSLAQRKIVCAADISVENAPEVKISYYTSRYDSTGSTSKYAAAQAELAKDLAQRTKQAITQNMRAVR